MELPLALTELFTDLGIMSWPLLICSALTLALILERTLSLLVLNRLGSRKTLRLIQQGSPTDQSQCDEMVSILKKQNTLMAQGLGQLLTQRHFDRSLREDSAGMWLAEKRTQLKTGLKVLSLIGVIAPLLGLLGTVLGLIEMFKAVALTTGSITPSDLADGLGLAMRTTAVGLLVALPAICSTQLLGLWADKRIYKLEYALNHCNLWIQGVQYNNEHAPKSTTTSSTSSASSL